ncbi:MAG: radical SAM family heme chaperone HemW [Candidatus Margulisiibacteriota bacterium]
MAGLYIHIPFCRKKCDYCDFASVPIDDAADDNVGAGGRGSTELAEVQPLHDYLIAINNELRSYPGFVPSTIFIGGGTPTILDTEQLRKLMGIVRTPIGSGPQHIEFTIEGNPDSMTLDKLKLLRQYGANRLSIGAQSFNNDELRALGRIHDRGRIIQAFSIAREAGFNNINLDLMFGIPQQTLGSWQRTLDQALELGPEHLSCYGLQIEEGTPFHKIYSGDKNDPMYRRPGGASLPNDDTQFEMYKHTIDLLKSRGYHHYEISNFAKPGFECKHNMNYWKNGDYIGIGASAASHMGGKRRENPKDTQEYLNRDLYSRGGAAALLMSSESTPMGGGGASKTEITETILMNLRLLEGLDLDGFKKRFGASLEDLYGKELEKLSALGLIEILKGRLKLSENGLYLANKVFEEFV